MAEASEQFSVKYDPCLEKINTMHITCIEPECSIGFMVGWRIDGVADMNMLKSYVPPPSINSSVGTTGLNNS